MFEPVLIICALLCGLIARGLGLPALMGYLGAGFLLHAWGASGGSLLSQIADMGVTLLLFTIGLKLRPKELLEHMPIGLAVSQSLGQPGPTRRGLVISLGERFEREWSSFDPDLPRPDPAGEYGNRGCF